MNVHANGRERKNFSWTRAIDTYSRGGGKPVALVMVAEEVVAAEDEGCRPFIVLQVRHKRSLGRRGNKDSSQVPQLFDSPTRPDGVAAADAGVVSMEVPLFGKESCR